MPNNILLFLAEWINLIPFCLCPRCISEKPVGNKIIEKTNMIQEVNIISGKSSVSGAGRSGWGHSESLSRDFRGQSPLRIFRL